jgi:hypothetical protein
MSYYVFVAGARGKPPAEFASFPEAVAFAFTVQDRTVTIRDAGGDRIAIRYPNAPSLDAGSPR